MLHKPSCGGFLDTYLEVERSGLDGLRTHSERLILVRFTALVAWREDASSGMLHDEAGGWRGLLLPGYCRWKTSNVDVFYHTASALRTVRLVHGAASPGCEVPECCSMVIGSWLPCMGGPGRGSLGRAQPGRRPDCDAPRREKFEAPAVFSGMLCFEKPRRTNEAWLCRLPSVLSRKPSSFRLG